MGDEIPPQTFDLQLRGALGLDIILEEKLAERVVGPAVCIVPAGGWIPVGTCFGIAAGQKSRTGLEVDFDILAGVSGVYDGAVVVIQRAAVRIPRECSWVDV